MKGMRWIGYVAGRYVSRGRKNSPSAVLSVLGIATGVLALTVIIAVMNGFQLGFIENILEISSCHVRLEGVSPAQYPGLNEKISALPGVHSVLPFRELNVLLRGKQANPRGALIRGVPPDALDLDPGLAGKLQIESGLFDLEEPRNIVIGAELARYLSVREGDYVNLLSITGGLFTDSDDGSQVYSVSGIFRTGFYEYDLGWGFVNLESSAELFRIPEEYDDASDEFAEAAPELSDAEGPYQTPPVLGIKLKNRWQDRQVTAEIRKVLADSGLSEEGFTLSSWREYNRAFFGALRTEKLMMFILVGLIFIVVGLNIFQAQRRTVLERREEIGLLRAIGASDIAVRLVFVWDGFIIGLSGAGFGLALGLIISFNIQTFFTLLEGLVNFFISGINTLSFYFGGHAGTEEFAVFSPQIFYIKEIPSRVIPHEAVLIFLFGLLSALFAAWFASGKVSGTRPAEVLRYE